MRAAEVLAAVLQPALAMVQEASPNEYEEFILPTFKYFISLNTMFFMLKLINFVILSQNGFCVSKIYTSDSYFTGESPYNS